MTGPHTEKATDARRRFTESRALVGRGLSTASMFSSSLIFNSQLPTSDSSNTEPSSLSTLPGASGSCCDWIRREPFFRGL